MRHALNFIQVFVLKITRNWQLLTGSLTILIFSPGPPLLYIRQQIDKLSDARMAREQSDQSSQFDIDPPGPA